MEQQTVERKARLSENPAQAPSIAYLEKNSNSSEMCQRVFVKTGEQPKHKLECRAKFSSLPKIEIFD